MIPLLRSRSARLSRRLLIRPYSASSVYKVQATNKEATTPNVSATNAIPTSSQGSHDSALVESVEKGEKLRELQAPNRQGIWTRSQQPREKAMVGPRFEQTIMEDQVRTPYTSLEFTLLYGMYKAI